MNVTAFNHIHFVGIGGISVSAAARLARHLKKEVSGSDVAQSVITEKLAREGINIAIGHRAEHVGPRVDLVVYS
ncbi:MAG: UDP-N-acetylmuramate--L-alanine ligase, partial [Parcubacteria group bacterium]|nr:UDP-N-acetylmuramate--L-alanine ligase [Parcubacteria group bacterium]